jgi:hypothetical protein
MKEGKYSKTAWKPTGKRFRRIETTRYELSLMILNSRTILELMVNTANALNSRSLNESYNQQSDEQRLLSIGEILLQDSQSIPTEEDDFDENNIRRTSLYLFRGTLALFWLVQASLYPNHYNTPFNDRAYFASGIAKQYHNSPDVVWAVLGTIDSSQVDLGAGAHLKEVRTLLNFVAMRFGYSTFEPTYKPSRRERYGPLYCSTTDPLSVPATDMFDEESYPFCGWKALVGQLIRAGADPNAETPYGTALISVVVGAFSFCFGKRFYFAQYPSLEETLKKPGKGKIALLAWLEVLKNFGVDLEAYGRKEASILSREDIEWSGREIFLYRRDAYNAYNAYYHPYGLYLRLIGFEFGPNPEDWKFWFSDPTDQLVGDFWDMVEHPERSMPGAWDE